MQLLEQYQNLERSTGVQVTRSFVCQDNGGIVHQGAGDGYALHLTAGHLARPLVELFSKTDLFKCRDCFFAPHLFGNTGNGKRQLYVCKDGLVRDQVVALEDKADRVVPVGSQSRSLYFFVECR